MRLSGRMLLVSVLLLRCCSSLQSSGAMTAWAALVDMRESLSQIRGALLAPELDAASQAELKALMVKAEEESRMARTLAQRNGEELKKREAGLHRSIVLLRSKAAEAKRSKELADKKEADAARARCVAEKAQREKEELETEHRKRELDAKEIAEGTHNLIEQSRVADLELAQLRLRAKDLGLSCRRGTQHAARLPVTTNGSQIKSGGFSREGPANIQAVQGVQDKDEGARQVQVQHEKVLTGGGSGSGIGAAQLPKRDGTEVSAGVDLYEEQGRKEEGTQNPITSTCKSLSSEVVSSNGENDLEGRAGAGGPNQGAHGVLVGEQGAAADEHGAPGQREAGDEGMLLLAAGKRASAGGEETESDGMVGKGNRYGAADLRQPPSPTSSSMDGRNDVQPLPPPLAPDPYFESFFDRSLSGSLEAMDMQVQDNGREGEEGEMANVEVVTVAMEDAMMRAARCVGHDDGTKAVKSRKSKKLKKLKSKLGKEAEGRDAREKSSASKAMPAAAAASDATKTYFDMLGEEGAGRGLVHLQSEEEDAIALRGRPVVPAVGCTDSEMSGHERAREESCKERVRAQGAGAPMEEVEGKNRRKKKIKKKKERGGVQNAIRESFVLINSSSA